VYKRQICQIAESSRIEIVCPNWNALLDAGWWPRVVAPSADSRRILPHRTPTTVTYKTGQTDGHRTPYESMIRIDAAAAAWQWGAKGGQSPGGGPSARARQFHGKKNKNNFPRHFATRNQFTTVYVVRASCARGWNVQQICRFSAVNTELHKMRLVAVGAIALNPSPLLPSPL